MYFCLITFCHNRLLNFNFHHHLHRTFAFIFLGPLCPQASFLLGNTDIHPLHLVRVGAPFFRPSPHQKKRFRVLIKPLNNGQKTNGHSGNWHIVRVCTRGRTDWCAGRDVRVGAGTPRRRQFATNQPLEKLTAGG